MNKAASATSPPAAAPESVLPLGGYEAIPGLYDELRDERGALRSHWRLFLDSLGELGAGELTRRWELSSRLLRENDVVYNTRGDVRGLDQYWKVDALPHLLTPEDWQAIEAGVKQRAQVLNALLADIYGQQMFLREGVLPPELVFNHPGFLRPCHGMKVPGGTYLHLYAADLVRGPGGEWAVLADRTQAPSGAGYALENRMMLSRSLAEVFHEFPVLRLTQFFQTLREQLRSLAPHNRETPRMVLLSPGPYAETYFEHVYLARHMGVPLVEGGDLTTRDNCIYLKTIGGLQLVDVVVRHVNDSFCDPLELRYDSAVGVPGMVQAAYSGNVVVVNALGSGIVGSYALMGYLPAVARRVLGEDLRIPSVPTWWCGRSENLGFVLENMRRLVIKPAFPGTGVEPLFGEGLTHAQLAALRERLVARPQDFIAQKNFRGSSTPAWVGGKVEARCAVLRVYSLATASGYVVMPGGLTRISASADSPSVSMKRGGGSKDTWILSDKPVTTPGILQAGSSLGGVLRSPLDQPSRLAENMYWMGRYVERADATIRLLRSLLARLMEDAPGRLIPELPGLTETMVRLELFPGHPDAADPDGLDEWYEKHTLAVLQDASMVTALPNTLNHLRRISWVVRDRLSNDTWRVLHRLEAQLPAPGAKISPADALTQMNEMVLALSAYSGLAMESMTRGAVWRFLDIGRRLERSAFLLTLLASTMERRSAVEASVLQAVLEVADSSITYRSRYLSTVAVEPVLDLLLSDASNPRAVAFQVEALREHVAALPRDPGRVGSTPEEKAMGALQEDMDSADVAELCRPGIDGTRTALARLYDRMTGHLYQLSDDLSRSYFSHTEEVRTVGIPAVEERAAP